MNVAAY